MSSREERAQSLAVIDEAQSGQLSLDDFHRSWPDPGDPLIDAIFDETEDTTEHLLASWLRPGAAKER